MRVLFSTAKTAVEAATHATPEIAARWAQTPVIRSFSTEFPATGHTALDGFLTHVRGLDRSQWEAYAAGGKVSRYSGNTDEQNIRLLVSGQRRTALVDDLGQGSAAAEQKAQQIERAGLTAFRYRQLHDGLTVHNVAAAPDAATGATMMEVHQARVSPEREMALGMLLGYEPRDIAFYINRSFGYDGVRHLLQARLPHVAAA